MKILSIKDSYMRQALNATMNAEKRLANEINTAHNNLIVNSLEKEIFSFYDQVDENITRVKEIMYRFDCGKGA